MMDQDQETQEILNDLGVTITDDDLAPLRPSDLADLTAPTDPLMMLPSTSASTDATGASNATFATIADLPTSFKFEDFKAQSTSFIHNKPLPSGVFWNTSEGGSYVHVELAGDTKCTYLTYTKGHCSVQNAATCEVEPTFKVLIAGNSFIRSRDRVLVKGRKKGRGSNLLTPAGVDILNNLVQLAKNPSSNPGEDLKKFRTGLKCIYDAK